MERIESLEGKSVAIVGLGKSWHDYNLAKSHGAHFDEVWAINGVGSVIYHDRVFMMDPPGRFLDTDDAGGQTDGVTQILLNGETPIYTCMLDDRCKNLVEYPINEILEEFNCSYINNTVAYAIAFALWNKVSTLKLFGIDFSYKGNLHFAESGRACCEFWLSKAMHLGVEVEVAKTSALLDTDVIAEEKLYGSAVTGVIFNLKNNFGWKDAQDLNLAGQENGSPINIVERRIVDPRHEEV